VSSAVAADVELLDGVRLSDALRAGIYRLFAQTEHINKINVFPVADGDTGTNLSMTLSAVLATLERTPTAHAGTVLVRVADAAIDGARGNSGAILAQFLLGLGDWAGHLAQLSARDFAAAVKRGAKYAHDALTEPREGTLLTVLRDFAHELERLAGVRVPSADRARPDACARISRAYPQSARGAARRERRRRRRAGIRRAARRHVELLRDGRGR
jgi:dihydroxyacetone kinase-like predicted kinase